MGFLTTKSRYLEPSRSRFLFLLVALGAFVLTELGRNVYRPYAYEHRLFDFGLADSIGNLGGIVVMIFLGLSALNSTRRQSYRLAVFYSVGFVVYEFVQPFLPKGVFDLRDIYGTAVGFVISLLILTAVWRIVGPGCENQRHDAADSGPIA
jgi:hypothetical protein